MAQFATHDELAARLGLTFSTADDTRADTLLGLASGIIQQKTKQTITYIAGDVYTRPGDYDTRIRLPQRPVVNVSSVILNGVTLVEGDNFYIEGDELVRLNWNAAIQDSTFGLPWAGWGFPWWTLQVTYDHGYQVIPEIAKTVCMEMVVRVWVNPGNVAREMVGNVSTVYDNNRFSPAGLLMTDDEEADIKEFFRRHAGSIGLR